MPYDPTDPRSRLGGTTATTRRPGANVAPQYAEFGRCEPTETTAGGGRSWWFRSQTCVVNYAELAAGDRLERVDQPDEYMVLVPAADAGVTLTASAGAAAGGPEATEAVGPSLVIMPPGSSSVTAGRPTAIVRLFSSRAGDLTALCPNDGFYREPDPNVAPFVAWPDPPDGFRIRVHPLDAHPPEPGRFGRIFRCTTLMVNYFHPDPGPRNPAKLSPHHHDDFEQLSLQLAGDYVHHIRTPWVPDLAQWRDDEHRRCTSPSVTVIPPPSIHTSQGVGPGQHHLVDVFAPPRADFSAQPGWVLNAGEYPAPT